MLPLCPPVLSARSSAALFISCSEGKKESRPGKELLSARAAPGESQSCQPGLVSGKWGLKGCHGMWCMVEAVWGGWAWAGTSRYSSGTPLLLGAGSFMSCSAVTSFTVSGLPRFLKQKSLAWHRLQVPEWSCLSAA